MLSSSSSYNGMMQLAHVVVSIMMNSMSQFSFVTEQYSNQVAVSNQSVTPPMIQ